MTNFLAKSVNVDTLANEMQKLVFINNDYDLTC